MAGKEIAVKKYVVRLDAEERDRLNELIRKGKRSAQLLTAVATTSSEPPQPRILWLSLRNIRGRHPPVLTCRLVESAILRALTLTNPSK